MLDRTPETLNFRRYHAVILGPLISRKLLKLESRNFRHISMVPNTHFRYENFSTRGVGAGGRPSCKYWSPHISDTLLQLESRNFTRIWRGQSTRFRYEIFPLGDVQGRSAPSVNLGPPHIPETTRARKLKFYTQFDGAKYSFQV